MAALQFLRSSSHRRLSKKVGKTGNRICMILSFCASGKSGNVKSRIVQDFLNKKSNSEKTDVLVSLYKVKLKCMVIVRLPQGNVFHYPKWSACLNLWYFLFAGKLNYSY